MNAFTRVDGQQGKWFQRGAGGDVDDDSGPALPHLRHHGANYLHRAERVSKMLRIVSSGVPSSGPIHPMQVLRIDEMPQIEVHIVPSVASPTGAGEPGGVPAPAAVANAVFAATGRMFRALPLNRI